MYDNILLHLSVLGLHTNSARTNPKLTVTLLVSDCCLKHCSCLMIKETEITESEGDRIRQRLTHTPGWMSLGMTARKKKRKVEKDLTFLFDLRFSWDSAVAPDFCPLMMGRGGLVQIHEDRGGRVPREDEDRDGHRYHR